MENTKRNVETFEDIHDVKIGQAVRILNSDKTYIVSEICLFDDEIGVTELTGSGYGNSFFTWVYSAYPLE